MIHLIIFFFLIYHKTQFPMIPKLINLGIFRYILGNLRLVRVLLGIFLFILFSLRPCGPRLIYQKDYYKHIPPIPISSPLTYYQYILYIQEFLVIFYIFLFLYYHFLLFFLFFYLFFSVPAVHALQIIKNTLTVSLLFTYYLHLSEFIIFNKYMKLYQHIYKQIIYLL